METLKFKTTINCGACVAKVTPILNEQENVKNWSVDTGNADKILTVEGENIDEATLIQSLSKIGYKAEKI
ncbi:heavy-metal-associated domain-containing protein [Nubsella zeaxanthinifaciens]|uniref:heavy-metal-associated domain-containing protein n=1 Tax=Nubsella zeaxanthinifaciens TaxID=392412 RepID=UPI000DE4663E|nr:heavy-metal-associated domain-containing protein [Nubsella zeaxanthinifaciens]